MEWFFIYLFIINLISGIIFSYDKFTAISKKDRVNVAWLHILEGLGGAFSILPLIYILRHKNRRSKYYMYTWIFLTLWVFIFLIIFFWN